MNKAVVTVGIFIGISCSLIHAEPLRVMSFNYQESVSPMVSITPKGRRQQKEFATRRKLTLRLLNDIKPDILGFQEPHLGDIQFFEKNLTSYQWIGEPIESVKQSDAGGTIKRSLRFATTGGKSSTDYNPIFFNTARLKLLKNGTFWLNQEKKRQASSQSWNIEGRDYFHVRACSWAQFELISNKKKLWVFNTHLSLEYAVIYKELELIKNEIAQIAAQNEPIIFMGDFNTTNVPPFITTSFINPTQVVPYIKTSNFGSYNDITIDYILLKNIARVAIKSYNLVDDTKNYSEDSITPSDHRPIYIDLSL